MRKSEIPVPLLDTQTPMLVDILAWFSLGGLSLLLAILGDLIGLLTLHLSLCGLLTSSLFRWQLYSLGSLFNLFRGGLHCDAGLKTS